MKMSSFLAFRHARHLSTAATAAGLTPITISQVKSKLRLSNIHNPDEALKIYKAFVAANDPSTSPSSTRHAQEFTVRLLAKAQRFSDIETFLESHKSNPQITDEPFLASLIRSYGVAGMFENALNTYSQMSDLGTPRSSISFNSLLNACVQCKLSDRVNTYFNELPEKFGFSPDKFSYGILIKSYCEMCSPEIAIEKLNEMKEKGFDVDVIVFNTILHSFYENERNDEAEKFWNEMVTNEGFKPNVGSYNVKLLNIKQGEPESLKGLIEEVSNAMSKARIKPDSITYNYMLTSYCENGMMDEAEKVYNKLLKAKGCYPNAATFTTIVFNLCKHERFLDAYEIYKKSVKEHKTLDFNTLTCLTEGLVRNERKKEAKALAEGLMRRGRKKEAKSMITAMKENKFPPNSLKSPLETEEVGSDDTEVENSSETQNIST